MGRNMLFRRQYKTYVRLFGINGIRGYSDSFSFYVLALAEPGLVRGLPVRQGAGSLHLFIHGRLEFSETRKRPASISSQSR